MDDSEQMKRNLIVGLILFLVIGGGGALYYFRDSIFAGSRTSRIERELAQAAQLINRRAPIRVDEITTLTGATAHGTQFTYQYTLTEDVATEQLEEARQTLQREIGSRVCADRDMGQAIRDGAVISADYRDASGDHLNVSFRTCPPAAR